MDLFPKLEAYPKKNRWIKTHVKMFYVFCIKTEKLKAVLQTKIAQNLEFLPRESLTRRLLCSQKLGELLGIDPNYIQTPTIPLLFYLIDSLKSDYFISQIPLIQDGTKNTIQVEPLFNIPFNYTGLCNDLIRESSSYLIYNESFYYFNGRRVDKRIPPQTINLRPRDITIHTSQPHSNGFTTRYTRVLHSELCLAFYKFLN